MHLPGHPLGNCLHMESQSDDYSRAAGHLRQYATGHLAVQRKLPSDVDDVYAGQGSVVAHYTVSYSWTVPSARFRKRVSSSRKAAHASLIVQLPKPSPGAALHLVSGASWPVADTVGPRTASAAHAGVCLAPGVQNTPPG